MSGSFESLDVPPTLVSFALAVGDAKTVISPEFKRAGSRVALLAPEYRPDGLPQPDSMNALLKQVHELISQSASAQPMPWQRRHRGRCSTCLRRQVGFHFRDSFAQVELFAPRIGAFVLELVNGDAVGVPLGETLDQEKIVWHGEEILIASLQAESEAVLEDVFPTRTKEEKIALEVPLLHADTRVNPRTSVPANRAC
ncbi:MAG: hypothetical protein R2881_04260 [Eubacteriales bacterium]